MTPASIMATARARSLSLRRSAIFGAGVPGLISHGSTSAVRRPDKNDCSTHPAARGLFLGVVQVVGLKLSPNSGPLFGHLAFFVVLLVRQANFSAFLTWGRR